MKKTLITFVLLIGTLLLSSCQKDDTIVLASKPMTEQYILAEMLTYLIEENTDLTVEHKQGIGGGTTNIHPGMLTGEIDLYPEYTGTGWLQVLKEDGISDPDELYQAVTASYDEEFDIHWSGLYGFNNGFGIAMKRDLAEEMGIKTYSDLFEKGLDLRFAANYDFFERLDGYTGLTEAYGSEFTNTNEMQIGLVYTALDADQVDAAIIFTTDGRLKQFNLLVLEDDLQYFTSYYAATLIRNETLKEYPELKDVIELLTNNINDEEMQTLNYEVEINERQPKDVAYEFLTAKGLLS